MAEDAPAPIFSVETVVLDLPALAGRLGQRLHDAGVPVVPARSADLARALTLVRPISRSRLYWTARAVLVSDQVHVAAFDRVFAQVFGAGAAEPAGDPAVGAATGAVSEADEHIDGAASPSQDAHEGWWTAPGAAGPEDGEAADTPLAMASDEERLAERRFETLDAQELAALYRLMSRLRLRTPIRTTRRYRRDRRGRQIDLRRTLRTSMRTGGEPLRLARRRRRTARRRLVMLCDISGSMEPYARAYLQFLTCAAGSGPDAEAFAFATRLTRLTRALASRHPELAIGRAAAAAPDWSSGTRIGEALRTFNDRHGRRGMARGAVVVILSDGWERGDPALVGREMARLARLAHRIVWVNPRAGADVFAVRAGGMVAALPHCNVLVSGHTFRALDEVVEAIASAPAARLVAGPTAPAAPTGEPEPWASATPVAGSSVAMPSGHGPRRGRTSPGWATGPGDEEEREATDR